MNGVRIGRAPLLGAAVTSFVLGIAATPAAAKNAPPQGVPAIAQYVETFPTAGGPVAAPSGQAPAPTGQAHETTAPVPARIARKIRAEGGSDSTLLEQLAASGARQPGNGTPPASKLKVQGLPAAVISRGGSAFVWLVAGILATSAGAAGLVFARRLRNARR
jgi:hypothetical protein